MHPKAVLTRTSLFFNKTIAYFLSVMSNANDKAKPSLRSPVSIASAPSPNDRRTRRNKISRVLSKVRFREVEKCSDEENDVPHTQSAISASASNWKEQSMCSPRSTNIGNSVGGQNVTSPCKVKEFATKHLGSCDRVRSEATPRRHSKYSPARKGSGRISLGPLPPRHQSVREMSFSTRNTRDIEPAHDRRKSFDIMRSHSERYGKVSSRHSMRDEAKVRSWGNSKGKGISSDLTSPKSERGSIEAIFSTTSTLSNSEGDSISLKGFFQNLIALENETL